MNESYKNKTKQYSRKTKPLLVNLLFWKDKQMDKLKDDLAIANKGLLDACSDLVVGNLRYGECSDCTGKKTYFCLRDCGVRISRIKEKIYYYKNPNTFKEVKND